MYKYLFAQPEHVRENGGGGGSEMADTLSAREVEISEKHVEDIYVVQNTPLSHIHRQLVKAAPLASNVTKSRHRYHKRSHEHTRKRESRAANDACMQLEPMR